MRRVWSARAARHLDEIRGYIARDNSAAAERIVARIVKATERLERDPFSARPGAIQGTRELVLSDLPYIVVYAVGADTIEIHAVLHTARNPANRGLHEPSHMWGAP